MCVLVINVSESIIVIYDWLLKMVSCLWIVEHRFGRGKQSEV